MRLPPACYQIEQTLAEHLSTLRPAQQRGLALWVYGTILAHSACLTAVITALLVLGPWHALRQRLREWLCDGPDKAAPCQTEVDVPACFAPLLRWLLSWWQGRDLALAIDATLHGDRVTALVVSVLYRGGAIPVAWHILPANRPGAWIPPLLHLLWQLHAAIPRSQRVLVLADRGLWSPRLWRRIRRLGWHPVLRLQAWITFAPAGQCRRPARALVAGPGQAWVGRGTAFNHRQKQQRGTLIVVWVVGQRDPWVLLTDVAPDRVGVSWYGLRMWIELGFRALKGVGWQWQKTRRTDPDRVARHWLVLAVATLWVLAYGTRVEDAAACGRVPQRLLTAPAVPLPPRRVSVFQLGRQWLAWHVARGRLWRRLWLRPEPWPVPPTPLVITYHLGLPP